MKLNSKKSPFAMLGVSLDASEEEIKQAYRRKAMQYHPDRNPSEDAANRFREIRQAYEILKSPVNRDMIRKLLHKYGDTAALGTANRPPPQQTLYGNKAPPSGFGKEKQQSKGIFEIVYDLLVYDLFKIISYINFKEIQFKLLFCIPFLGFTHYSAILSTTGDFNLSFRIFFTTIIQGCIVACLIEAFSVFARFTHRYALRKIVNWFVVRGFVLALIVLLFTSLAAGRAFLTNWGLVPEIVNGLAWWGILMTVYSWIIFCFSFQKHDPTWEVMFIWIGVLGSAYLLIQIFTPFSLSE